MPDCCRPYVRKGEFPKAATFFIRINSVISPYATAISNLIYSFHGKHLLSVSNPSKPLSCVGLLLLLGMISYASHAIFLIVLLTFLWIRCSPKLIFALRTAGTGRLFLPANILPTPFAFTFFQCDKTKAWSLLGFIRKRFLLPLGRFLRSN